MVALGLLLVGLGGCGGGTATVTERTVIRTVVEPSSSEESTTGSNQSRSPTSSAAYVTDSGLNREFEPSEMVFGNHVRYLELKWRDWGSPRTEASGQVETVSCVPNCAEGEPEISAVRLELSDLAQCEGKLQYTAGAVISGGGPVSGTLPLPCAPAPPSGD